MMPTRKELAEKFPNANTISKYNNIDYLYNPTIDKVERGMMIRAWASPKARITTIGEIVESVDLVSAEVEVRCNTGGTREEIKKFPINQILVCWSIGTYDHAMRLLQCFTKALSKMA